MFKAVTIIAAAAAANAEQVAVSVTGEASGTKTKLRIGLEWFLNPDHMPFAVAEREGFFAEAGLEVELVAPKDHWEAEQEIIAGRLDVAVTETLHLAQDAASSKPIIGFSRFLHTDGGVMYFAGKGISRPRDMCGATITYPGSPGLGGPAIVQTMVEADGGTCDVESYGKYNGGFDHVGALGEGKADVATLIFANFEIPFATAAGHNASFFSLKEWGVPDFCQLVLMTTPERFEQLKPALRALVLAMRRATGVIHREPERAKELYQKHEVFMQSDPMPMATLDQTLPMFPNDNSLPQEYFDHLMKWLVGTKQVPPESSAIAPSVYWTNEVALP